MSWYVYFTLTCDQTFNDILYDDLSCKQNNVLEKWLIMVNIRIPHETAHVTTTKYPEISVVFVQLELHTFIL